MSIIQPILLNLNNNSQSVAVSLNYKFQQPDNRDYKFVASAAIINKVTTPDMINFSLNKQNIIILNQGNIGSCVSNAFAQCINIVTYNTLAISRLCHYYCGRAILGVPSTEDTGLDIRQAATIISKYGAARESAWPYNTSNFKQLPPLNVFQGSKYFQKYVYTFINQDLTNLKACLLQNKTPIIFGIMIYSSFVSATVTKTGTVPLPDTKKEQLLGGHCVLMIGYDDATKTFLCINSWGTSWGAKGFFTLPYAYVTNPALAGDFCSLNFIY